MRITLLFVLTFLVFNPAAAEPTRLFYANITVKVTDLETKVPVTLFAQTQDQSSDVLQLTAIALLEDLLPIIATAIEKEINKRHRGCRERWSAWDGEVQIVDGMVSAKVTVRVEKWTCENVLGKDVKARLARETATVRLLLQPSVVDGRLQAQLSGFSIDDLSTLLRQLGLEQFLRSWVVAELDRFNQDPAQNTLPDWLSSLGFQYEKVVLETASGAPVARVSIVGPNNLVGLFLAAAKRGLK